MSTGKCPLCGHGSGKEGPALAEILAAIEKVTGIPAALVRGPRQHTPIWRARTLFYRLAHDLRPDLNTGTVANWIGRERSTVRDGQSRAMALLDKDADWCSQYEQARRMLV